MLHLKTNPTLTYEKALSERNESFAVSEAPNHLSFQSEYDIDNHKLKNVEDIQLLVKSESKTAEIAEVLFFVNGSFGRRVVVPVSSNDVNLTDVATSLITSASRDTNKKFVGELWVNRTVTSEPDVEEVVMVGDIPRAAEPTQESSVQMNTAVQVVPQPVPPITPAQQAIVLARSALVSQKPLLAVRPAIATASTAVIVQSQPLVVSAGGQMVVSTHQPIVSTSIGSLFQVTPGDFIVQNVQPKVIPTPETAKASEDNKTMSNGVKDSNGVAKPADQYPLIEVVFAHCSHCGSNSKDLKVCIYCRKPLPKDAKLTKMYQHSMNAPPAKAPEAQYKLYTTVQCQSCGRSSMESKVCVNCKALLPDDAPKIIVKVKVHPDTPKAESRPKRKCTRKRKVEEPVTLSLISSDEEDGENSREKPPVAPTPPQLSVNDKEPIITEDTLSPLHNERIEGGGMELNDIMKKPDIERAMVNCRSVRIGSYKVTPKERIVLTEYGIYLDAPSLETKEWVTVSVMKNEIIKVLVNFGKSCPVLFFYITARGAAQVRKALGMTPGGNPYFDPTSNIEPYRRITLLPDKVSEETRLFIKGTYDKQCLLETLGEKEVDTILVKASPTSDSIVNAPLMTPSRGDISSNFGVQTPTPSGLSTGGPQMGNPSAGNAAQSLVRKIMVYPPPPAKGGIPINTEDYACLGEDNFLNDIIIDFYLKYFVATHLSPEDQKRTHVFSSFFYKRLTTKDPNPNPNDKRTAAERRHHRVRSWTKQVDLFSKDFIIIPINENSHWFLGVICFPGLTQAVRMVDNKPVPNPSRRIGNVPHMIGGTTITRVNQEPMTITLEPDEEDRDEADAEDDDLEPNTSDEEPCEEPEGGSELLDDATHPLPKVKVKKEPLDPIKQPCILIFDSLVGASRSKVCATLREYIQVEYNVRHKDTKGKRDINPVTFKATVVKVPQQTNYTDCGLYVLQYVEAFFQNPIMDYRMPIKQLVDWFDTTIVSKKRYQIQQLLHKIMEEQNIDISRLNLPLLNLHPDGTGKSFTTEDEDDDMGEEMGMDDYDDMGEEEEIGEDDEEMQNMEFQRPSNVANASRSQPPTPTPSQISSPQQPEEIRSRLVRKDISITSSIASSIGSSISISSSPVSTSPAKTVPLVPQSISVTRKVVSISSPGKLSSSPAKLDPSAISITSSTGVKRKIVSPVTNLKDIRNPRLAQPGTLSRSVEIKKIRPE